MFLQKKPGIHYNNLIFCAESELLHFNNISDCPPLSKIKGSCGQQHGGRCNKDLKHDALYCNLKIGKCEPSFEHNSATLEDVYDWKPESCKVWRSDQACKRRTTTPKTSRTESEIILYLDNIFFNKQVTMTWLKSEYETNFNNRYFKGTFRLFQNAEIQLNHETKTFQLQGTLAYNI